MRFFGPLQKKYLLFLGLFISGMLLFALFGSRGLMQIYKLKEERDRIQTSNVRLQEDLAAETQGRSYDLTTVSDLPKDLEVKTVTEHYTRNHSLWSTPLWFMALVGLMLGEWFTRKMIHLA